MNYDLVVLGGGPGGYLAAERAGAAGLSVTLIEKNKLGGTCLNEGCIPSKAFLQSAKVADYAKHAASYGVNVSYANVDQKAVVERKNRIVRKLVGGVKVTMRETNVNVVLGEGVLVKDSNGAGVKVGEQIFYGKNIIIATGSESVMPPITGAKDAYASGKLLTNREILDLTVIPDSLTVIGGGVIGLEMASYFNSVGSRVTVIEMLDRIGGQTESQISEMLKTAYEKKGIEFILGAKVVGITDDGVNYEIGGETKKIECDKILMSVGRRANTANIGLESLNIATERGAIVTDGKMKTNVPNVYAVGDVNGKVMLAHTAYREAEVAVNTILGKTDEMSYDYIPSVIYTNPEVACVGLTEEAAQQKGINAKVVSLPMQYSGRFVAENADPDGICKLVFDIDKNTLIGAHMMGNSSGEIIYGVAMLINTAVDVETIKRQIFPHPTVSEIIRECVFKLDK